MPSSLFNGSTFNTSLFNGGGTPVETFSEDTLVFEGLSLSDGESIIMERLDPGGNESDFLESTITRGHGKFLNARYFRGRPIKASGIIKAASASELADLKDLIRKRLRIVEGDLDLTEANGIVKRFKATLANYEGLFPNPQHYHITYQPWEAEFSCKPGFGLARTYTSDFFTINSSPTNYVIANAGTFECKPIIILIFSAATAITAFKVENDTTGDALQLTGAIAAGDVLEFDCEAQEVRLNGAVQDYGGAFFPLDVDTNLLIFTATGTSYSADCTIKRKLTYL